MKITFKGDYALKVILDLSMTFNQGMSQMKEISKRQDIPERFLEQIITILKNSNYLKTVRGAKGGIYLVKSPAKITVGEIIRLIEGTTAPIACVSKSCYSKCDFESKCAFKELFQDIREKINDVVDNTTFQDLIERTKELDSKSKKIVDYVI